MRPLESCPRCGATIDSRGSCTACLISAAMTPPEAPDLAGTRLGPYEIGRILGQGGVGVVYEAVDTRPTSCRYGHTVALKILAADLDAPEQLVREAQLLGELEHEHQAPSAGIGDVLGTDLGQSGLVRLVPVRGTPFSVLVHVAHDGPLASASPPLRR